MTTPATEIPITIVWKFSSATPAATRDGLTTWVMTSGVTDRDGERVYAPGIDASEFDLNPVALAMHQMRSLPVGRWENRRLVGSGWDAKMVADLRLAPLGVSPVADEVRGLVEAGMLNMCSVGFQSIERAIGPAGTVDHMRTLLLECSLCSVGANPESLRIASLSRTPRPEPVVYVEPSAAVEKTYLVEPAMLASALKSALPALIEAELARACGSLDVEGFRASRQRKSAGVVSRSLIAGMFQPEAVERRALAPAMDLERIAPERQARVPVLELPTRYLR